MSNQTPKEIEMDYIEGVLMEKDPYYVFDLCQGLNRLAEECARDEGEDNEDDGYWDDSSSDQSHDDLTSDIVGNFLDEMYDNDRKSYEDIKEQIMEMSDLKPKEKE